MRKIGQNMIAVFPAMDALIRGIRELDRTGVKEFIVYSPVPHHDIEYALRRPQSPVRVFTLVGGLTGFCTGWALTIGSVLHYPLIVGGKPLISIPPFGVLAYILTILFGALATVIGLIVNTRLPRFQLSSAYDERFSEDHYGIEVWCGDEQLKTVETLMRKCGASEVRSISE